MDDSSMDACGVLTDYLSDSTPLHPAALDCAIVLLDIQFGFSYIHSVSAHNFAISENQEQSKLQFREMLNRL